MHFDFFQYVLKWQEYINCFFPQCYLALNQNGFHTDQKGII